MARISTFLAVILFVVAVGVTGLSPIGGAGTAEAQQAGAVPGGSLGTNSDADLWRAVRNGEQFSVSIPNKQAGVLIQSDGEAWRSIRNGPLSTAGAWSVFGILGVLAVFYLLRGRIMVDHGLSGRLIERFNGIERFGHWLVAVSFIILAITGLNVMYGRYVLLPIIGPELFSMLSIAGKYAHNFIAFPFMLGLVLIFFMWVRHNIPNATDLVWLAKGGGLFVKGSHPPAKKFNAGQKLIFWSVIIGGFSLSLSGIALIFPFEVLPWAKTFAMMNVFGFSLPTDLTVMQEIQLSQLWHGVVALFMIAIILAHIYIGSVGMQGAFDAMGSGMVDVNWAKEHHSLWVDEVKGQAGSGD